MTGFLILESHSSGDCHAKPRRIWRLDLSDGDFYRLCLQSLAHGDKCLRPSDRLDLSARRRSVQTVRSSRKGATGSRKNVFRLKCGTFVKKLYAGSRPLRSTALNGPGSAISRRAASTWSQTFHNSTPRTRPSRK